MKYTPQTQYRLSITTVINLLDEVSTLVKNVDTVVLQVESGNIRYLYDGNTPTTFVGVLLEGERTISKLDLKKLKLVSTGGTAVVTVIIGTSLTLT